MKKKYLILFMLVIAAHGLAYGQINFGVKSGINLSNITSLFPNAQTKVGFHAGLLSEIQLNDKFFLRPEIIYAQKGSKTPKTIFHPDGVINFHYINIPILLGYKPTETLSLFIGPELGYLMKAISKFDEKNYDRTHVFEKIDLGVGLGAGYHISPRLSAEIRYIYGLDGLIKANDADDKGQPNGEFIRAGANRVFQLGISYFLIKK